MILNNVGNFKEIIVTATSVDKHSKIELSDKAVPLNNVGNFKEVTVTATSVDKHSKIELSDKAVPGK